MADLKIFTENIEHEALNQIYTLVKQPAFSDCKIRIMPDVHAGAGCVIGFTADLGEKVIPNIVGVDVGCGMLTTNLGNIDIDFERLDNVIREYVPSGRKVHEEENSSAASDIIEKLYCKEQLKNIDWLKRSCGTLGGGNHFIEVDSDNRTRKLVQRGPFKCNNRSRFCSCKINRNRRKSWRVIIIEIIKRFCKSRISPCGRWCFTVF